MPSNDNISTLGPAEWTAWMDGSCDPNPGPGGWGAIITSTNGQSFELGDGESDQTSNIRMEMTACVCALEYLLEVGATGCVTIKTDLELIPKGMTEWLPGWKANGWKAAKKKQVLNKDLWQRLDDVVAQLQEAGLVVSWKWVRGHAMEANNLKVDQIAKRQMERARKSFIFPAENECRP